MRSPSSMGTPRRCPPPRSSPTSLSRDASRCSGLSDMRNCRVVSAMGWGPGRSGAYWTFRITKRTEFLGGRWQEENPGLRLPSFLVHFGVKSLFSSGLLGQQDSVGGASWMPHSPGLEGAAPRPCQAARVAPRSAAVEVSNPSPRSSLTHPCPGKHLHPSSSLGNTSGLESVSIPAPAW